MGLALRAAGHDMKTFIGQFLKGQSYGELKSIDMLGPMITIKQFGRKDFIHVSDNPDKQDIQLARDGLKTCKTAMLSGEYDIIILDEINVTLHFKLLEEQEVYEFLDNKPKPVEVILTGRLASESLIKRADLVTEMKNIKHYFDSGVNARIGIEK